MAIALCRQQVPPMEAVADAHRVACFAVGASQ
jgi:hypothetical protein